jgi:hypothetical protein
MTIIDHAALCVPADFAVRCSKLADCGWGWRPSINAAHTARAETKCARCGAPMEIVTAREFQDRLPRAPREDVPS